MSTVVNITARSPSFVRKDSFQELNSRSKGISPTRTLPPVPATKHERTIETNRESVYVHSATYTSNVRK